MNNFACPVAALGRLEQERRIIIIVMMTMIMVMIIVLDLQTKEYSCG